MIRFCKPSDLDMEDGEGDGGPGKLSSGMGLGEGEGQKDVSDRIENQVRVTNICNIIVKSAVLVVRAILN